MAERETPSVMADVVEEILLRFPPDDPESLLRAALVSKSWCRLVCSPDFNRRFREFHQQTSPPVLGFFHRSCQPSDPESVPGDTGFMPLTSSFRRLPHAFMPNWSAVDARHGRVLFYDVNDMAGAPESVEQLHLIVWNPFTRAASVLPVARMNGPMTTWSAALLCDDSGRDTFQVVLVASVEKVTSAHVYSSEQHVWSTSASNIQHPAGAPRLRGRNALVGNALYFRCRNNYWILVYDISKQELTFISGPVVFGECKPFILMAAEDGGLGVAMLHRSRLYMWSLRQVDLHGYEHGLYGEGTWALQRVFPLDKLLPTSALSTTKLPTARVVAAENGLSAVFVRTYNSLFVIDLQFGRIRKICNYSDGRTIVGVVPYASFCTPGTCLIPYETSGRKSAEARNQM